ncbi:hypothetical protein LCGC14_3110170, partial [marine sediment metagenome]
MNKNKVLIILEENAGESLRNKGHSQYCIAWTW